MLDWSMVGDTNIAKRINLSINNIHPHFKLKNKKPASSLKEMNFM